MGRVQTRISFLWAASLKGRLTEFPLWNPLKTAGAKATETQTVTESEIEPLLIALTESNRSSCWLRGSIQNGGHRCNNNSNRGRN